MHRIDTAIRKNPFVLHRRVFLESTQGKITLRGKVDSYYQKQMVQEVLRGMEANSERSMALLDRKLPKSLHGLGRDFAGVKGSRVYNALLEGRLSYRSYCFRKG